MSKGDAVTLVCISNGNPNPELTITVDGTQHTGSGPNNDGRTQYNVADIPITKNTRASCDTINGKSGTVHFSDHSLLKIMTQFNFLE